VTLAGSEIGVLPGQYANLQVGASQLNTLPR
jgi:hypothetical protein